MKTQNEELKEILIKHNALNKTMEEVVEYGTELYQDLCSYYMNNGEMPYKVAKGHHGNPDEWVADKLYESGLIKD
jgi:hypothetical protein